MKKLTLLLGGAVIAASLTGCADRSGVVPQSAALAAPIAPFALPDFATIPGCKGQKTSKDYAQSQPEGINLKGGTGCVPKFKGWGGGIKYPAFSGGGGNSMTVISSTTAYDANFPPSSDAIFYIQIAFNGYVRFTSTLPAGPSLASQQLKAKKPYTIEAAEPVASLWQLLPSCYSTASVGKYGPTIGGLGFPLKNYEVNAVVISIYPGKLTTTKC